MLVILEISYEPNDTILSKYDRIVRFQYSGDAPRLLWIGFHETYTLYSLVQFPTSDLILMWVCSDIIFLRRKGCDLIDDDDKRKIVLEVE